MEGFADDRRSEIVYVVLSYIECVDKNMSLVSDGVYKLDWD